MSKPNSFRLYQAKHVIAFLKFIAITMICPVLFFPLLFTLASLQPDLPFTHRLGSFEAKQNLRVGGRVRAHGDLRSLLGKVVLREETTHRVALGFRGRELRGHCGVISPSHPTQHHMDS